MDKSHKNESNIMIVRFQKQQILVESRLTLKTCTLHLPKILYNRITSYMITFKTFKAQKWIITLK